MAWNLAKKIGKTLPRRLPPLLPLGEREEEREWEVKGGKEGRPEKPTLDSKGTKATSDLTQNCDTRKRRRNGVGYGNLPNIILLV